MPTEAKIVEVFVRDLLGAGITDVTAVGLGLARIHGRLSGLRWHCVAPQNPLRQPQEVLAEDYLREALIRLNPEIAARPDRTKTLDRVLAEEGRDVFSHG